MVCVCCQQECECNNVCRYSVTASASYDGWPASVSATATPASCESCVTTNAADTESNPLRVSDQVGVGNDNLFDALADVVQANPDRLDGYVSIGERYDDGDDEEQKSTAYSVSMSCGRVNNKASWSVVVSFSYVHTVLLGNPATRYQYTSLYRFSSVNLTGCPNPCNFTVEITPDGFELNGTAYGWDFDDSVQTCEDYDENGNPTACDEYLYEPLAAATVTAACREECDEFP